MLIKERAVGPITILDLQGKITIGEGDVLLREWTQRLVAARRTKVVLNLADVSYVDSAGNGEVVRTYTTISRAGGKIVILNPTKKILDLWTIQKLVTVYDVYDDEAKALASFGAASVRSACPVCGVDAVFAAAQPMAHSCASCSAEIAFHVPQELGARVVDHVKIPTYDGEHVLLRADWPYVLSVQGRLDLFSAEALEEAWRIVPHPRRILVDLGAECRAVTPRGLRALAALCQPEAGGGRTVAWLHDDAIRAAAAAGSSPPFFEHRAAALAALEIGDLRPTPIVVEVARR